MKERPVPTTWNKKDEKKSFWEIGRKPFGWWRKKKPETKADCITPTGRIVNPYQQTSGQVWNNWNNRIFVDTGTTANFYQNTWVSWNRNAQTIPITISSASVAQNTIIWQTWNANAGTMATNQMPLIQVMTHEWPTTWLNPQTGAQDWPTRWLDARPAGVPARHIVAQTPEEIAAQRERERQTQERYQREWQAAEAGRKLADAKARKILMEHLSPVQRDQYEKFGYFDLDVGGRTYRIKKGWSGNVQRLGKDEKNQDRVLESFCIHPRERIPEEDNLLIQKLMLETEEAEFRRIANITVHDGGRYLQGRA